MSVKVGLIGCGAIAGRHVDWFLAHPECEIAALCDLSAEAVEKRVEQVQGVRPGCSVRATQDHHELLGMPEVDAVAVLLPHALHYPIVKDALEADKHVLVEKPMVNKVSHAQDLIRRAGERGKLLAIGYQRSTMSEYQAVRRMVETGELGEVQFVSAHLEQSWYKNFCGGGSGDSWRTDAAAVGGGQLVDTGSHTVAAMLDVTQLVPEEAFAFVQKRNLDVDVNTAAAIRFTNGAVGALCIGGFGHSVTEVLRVVGEKKSARIFFRTVREQSLEVDGELMDAKSEIPPSTPNADFVEAILGRGRVRADGVLGLRVAQLTEALYASVEQGKPARVSC